MQRNWKFALLAMMALISAVGLTACGGSAPKGPVNLKIKQVHCNASDGSVQSEQSWTYDEKGNVTNRTTKMTRNGFEVVVEDSYGDFDQEGYPASLTTKNGSEERSPTYGYKREADRVTEEIGESGTRKFTYHDNAQVKTVETTNSKGSTSAYEYDTDGYLIKSSSSGGANGDTSSTVEWTKDDKGIPTEAIYTTTSSGKSNLPVKYTIQCDENGNIVRLYAALGKLYEECEYTKIDSPTTTAWTRSLMIDGQTGKSAERFT